MDIATKAAPPSSLPPPLPPRAADAQSKPNKSQCESTEQERQRSLGGTTVATSVPTLPPRPGQGPTSVSTGVEIAGDGDKASAAGAGAAEATTAQAVATDGDVLGSSAAAPSPTATGIGLSCSAGSSDDVDGDYELARRMLSPQGLLIKKVLPEGIAYPVRLRLLMQNTGDGDVGGDGGDHRNRQNQPQQHSVLVQDTHRPWVSLSLTWLEGDECGLDLCGLMAVRPYHGTSPSSPAAATVVGAGSAEVTTVTAGAFDEQQLESSGNSSNHNGEGGAPLKIEEVEAERRSDCSTTSRREEGLLYNRLSPVGNRRQALGNSRLLLLLAWEDVVLLQEQEQQEQHQQSPRVGDDDAGDSEADEETDGEDGDEDSDLGAGGTATAVLQLEAESEEQRDALARCLQQLVVELRSQQGWHEDLDGGSLNADRRFDGETVATSVTGGGGADEDSKEGDGGNKKDEGEDERDDVLGFSLILNRPVLPYHEASHQQRQPRPRQLRPPRPPSTRAPKPREPDHKGSGGGGGGGGGGGTARPPRGTQRYWSVGDLSSKSVLLRRRRSAGVRTAAGQYIGGNLVRGTSVQLSGGGQRRSMMLQNSVGFGSGGGGGSSVGDALMMMDGGEAAAFGRSKEVSARVHRLYDRWRDEARVAAWTIAVMKLQTILAKSATRGTHRRWETWCAVVRRENREKMVSDRRQWFLHAVANEGNDLQAWYQSTFHREVYRIKGPFWYKFTGLEKFDKAYRKTPDRPLTELERRMIYSCVSSSGTRYSDIAFHDFTAQAVLTREEMRLFWNLMERDVEVPRSPPEAIGRGGKRASQPRALRLLFYKGRLDLMWEGKPDRFGNTTAHDNFSRIAQMHLRPTFTTASTAATTAPAAAAAAAAAAASPNNPTRNLRAHLNRTMSDFSSNGSGSSSTSNSDQDGAKKNGHTSSKSTTRTTAGSSGATTPIVGGDGSEGTTVSTTAEANTKTLIRRNSSDSAGSIHQQQPQGRGMARLAAQRLGGISTDGAAAPAPAVRERADGTERVLEGGVSAGRSGGGSKGAAAREGDEAVRARRGSGGSGREQQDPGGVEQRERDGRRRSGEGGEDTVMNGCLLSVFFLGATGTLDLWFPTEKQGKTWQGMLKKLAAKEKGYMYDYRKVKNHRRASTTSASSSGRSSPPPSPGLPARSDSATSDTPPAQSRQGDSTSGHSVCNTTKTSGNRRSSSSPTTQSSSRHGARLASHDSEWGGDDCAGDVDVDVGKSKATGEKYIPNRKSSRGRELRNSHPRAKIAGERRSPIASPPRSQEYRIDDLIGRQQVSAGGGLCSAR